MAQCRDLKMKAHNDCFQTFKMGGFIQRNQRQILSEVKVLWKQQYFYQNIIVKKYNNLKKPSE